MGVSENTTKIQIQKKKKQKQIEEGVLNFDRNLAKKKNLKPDFLSGIIFTDVSKV